MPKYRVKVIREFTVDASDPHTARKLARNMWVEGDQKVVLVARLCDICGYPRRFGRCDNCLNTPYTP